MGVLVLLLVIVCVYVCVHICITTAAALWRNVRVGCEWWFCDALNPTVCLAAATSLTPCSVLAPTASVVVVLPQYCCAVGGTQRGPIYVRNQTTLLVLSCDCISHDQSLDEDVVVGQHTLCATVRGHK